MKTTAFVMNAVIKKVDALEKREYVEIIRDNFC